ncbi:hypothetical protein [Krasilnikovia sp. MM14-A1004]|uniref:hypothetical protein n=1 Tax=Krasilnikovia sp. MM14-A1004 TaxID=3373541 RepID=UPI00399C78C7
MLIVTSPPPDRRLIAAAVRHKSTGVLWMFRILGLLLVVISLVDLLTSGLSGVPGIVLGLLAVFGVPPWLVGRAVNRCWRIFGADGTFTLTDWGVQRDNPLTRIGYAWSLVKSVEELPGQLIFSLSTAGFLPLPTGTLAPGEREQILAMAAHQGVPVSARG